MKFSSESHARSLEIIKEEEELQRWPSFKLDVRLETEALRCRRSVWVGGDELTDFEAALTRLEANRKGEAQLGSMSPNEFDMKVAVREPEGHIMLSVRLSGRQLLLDGLQYAAEAEFQIDPSSLVRLVTEINRLRTSPMSDGH